MKSRSLLFFVAIIITVLFACEREYSDQRAKKGDADFPYATGYCDGVSLGIPIADTIDYTPLSSSPLPVSFFLEMPIPGNQGSQGSCTAWATVYAAGTYYIHQTTGKAYSDTGNLSPKFTYNQITKGDCRCTSFLDHVYLLKTYGACSLGTMPYDPKECLIQPDSIQFDSARRYKINGWEKVNLHNLTEIKRAITEKHPVLFAIKIDDGFNHLRSPFIWKEIIGQTGLPHALVITGYDDNKNCFRFMNSWSTEWGDGGFGWIEYNFFLRNVLKNGYIII